MPIRQADENFMRNAVSLAAKGKGKVSPNPLVGAVVVNGGKIVGRGWHARLGGPHAEAAALEAAGEASLGSTLYCTLEPCCHHGRTPPCTQALIDAGVKRVVVGAGDPSPKVDGKGVELLRAEGIEVDVGCLVEESRRVNEFFLVRHELGRPFVTLKWAATLDGRTAADSNDSRWITNEASRNFVHELRAEHDCVLAGIGTILADDPMLNVRVPRYKGRQPKRVIVDGDLSIPRRARVLRSKDGGEVIIVTTSHARPEAVKDLESDGHTVVVLPSRRRLIKMDKLLEYLAERDFVSVFAEGGRQIHTSLIRAGCADKLYAFMAPKIVGGQLLRSPVEDLGVRSMDEALQIKRPRWHAFGDDICLEGYLRDV